MGTGSHTPNRSYILTFLRGYEFYFEGVFVLQVGGVVGGAASVGVEVGEEEAPAVGGGGGGEVVQGGAVLDVEGQVVEAGA
jgi:hypothetical protein